MTTTAIIKRTLRRARKYWPHIASIFVLNFLAAPIYLLKPLALKILIDSGFGGKPLPEFIRFFWEGGTGFMTVVWISITLVLAIALLENLYNLVIWILNTYTGEKLVRTFRYLLFDHIQRLSLAYHDKKGTADSVYRIQNDTSAIRSLIISNLSPIITSGISLITILVIMFSINWRFGLITCCMLPPLTLLIRYSSRKLKRNWKAVKQSESNAMSVVQEVLTSLRVVKSFSQESEESSRFMSKADVAMKGQIKVATVSAMFHFSVGMIFATGTALFIYFGSIYVQTNVITLGLLTMLLAYLSQIYTPLEKISRNINEIQSSLTSLERVYTLLDQEKEVDEAAKPVHISRSTGHVEFRNVSFGYNAHTEILKNISFHIKPGDRVGIMGSTGSGKTTLINLLSRFYDPTSGEILIDGVDIRQYNLREFRNQFGIVLQEPVLFSTTIAENIAYGFPGANKEQIIEAARMANIHHVILNLPDGYDTVVGERGMTLSGGERQRVAIARAFIKNAPIMILDEPTSSLDIRTENLIMDAMDKLMDGRTSFMITHRIDTLSKCNVILHLDKGVLIEANYEVDESVLQQKKIKLLSTLN